MLAPCLFTHRLTSSSFKSPFRLAIRKSRARSVCPSSMCIALSTTRTRQISCTTGTRLSSWRTCEPWRLVSTRRRSSRTRMRSRLKCLQPLRPSFKLLLHQDSHGGVGALERPSRASSYYSTLGCPQRPHSQDDGVPHLIPQDRRKLDQRGLHAELCSCRGD